MSPAIAHRRGRPLLFLLVLALGWTGMRLAVVSLWPAAEGHSFLGQSVAADEDARDGLTARGADAAPVKPVPPAPERAGQFDDPVPAIGIVDGLQPAPPAHLAAPPVPLESAAAHNALWMAASGSSDPADDTVTREEAKLRQPW